ncbi:MAG: tail-specific protease [Betaproteobacteria bacterium]|nr:tail-specific protease [Betaproteobacteria bacterium]
MKQKLLWLLFALAAAGQAASLGAATPYPPELKPAPEEAKAAHLAADLLTRHHYKAMPLDAALSGKIFDQYLKSLDAEKLLFLQSDIERFAVFRTRLGEAIVSENLSGPFAMFNLYQRRAAERFAYARALLKKGFDFQQVENYQFAREKEVWPESQAQMDELWRKRVKNDWLRLKLAGKDDKSIVDLLDKRYDSFVKRIARVRSADAFQTFMNAYTMSIEPHTNYMGPRAAEEFGISMRLSLVGIGAVLAELDDYVTIRELIPGGPAALSAQLKTGDRILGVAQGESGVMTDILGWRVDDAVALIRGAPDSVVLLDILPAETGPDGKHKRVSLTRKTISLDARAAKASVHNVPDGKTARRVGVISLPTFYEDFAGKQKGLPDYKSATRDVARLLEELKKEKVDGVLIDLRNNGGGSMGEAIELTGMFIDKGPVVQQRSASGEVSVGSDNRAGAAWDGPLGVLINRASASSSEIFAAAIQDYGRGLIIGESSYGKGTVQTLVNLDRIAKNSKPQFGELKMTIAQFFRINGGTTQLRGVTPDILLPAVGDAQNIGESTFDNALPWTQIKAVDYAPAGDLKGALPILLALHEARVKKDKAFQYLQEDIAESRLQRKRNLVSLNETARREEQAAQEARLALRGSRMAAAIGEPADTPGKEPAAGKGNSLRDDGLQPEERNLTNQLAAEKARKDAKDVLLHEAVQILGDAVGVLQTGGRLAAARVKPGAVLTPN